MRDEDIETLWQHQAETYQTALESALAYQQELEQQVNDLAREILYWQGQLRTTTERHEDTLMQRDQVIITQEKEITHIKHILQIQQRLLQLRTGDTR